MVVSLLLALLALRVGMQIRRAREPSDEGPGVTPIPYEGWHR